MPDRNWLLTKQKLLVEKNNMLGCVDVSQAEIETSTRPRGTIKFSRRGYCPDCGN